MSRPTDSPWFSTPLSRPDARWRLVAFPYGGGGPQAYRGWAEALPDDVELLVLHLPGRGARLADPLIDDLGVLVDEIVGALAGCGDKPFAFFGHSVGALVAYETARVLSERHLPLPVHVVASAHHAPSVTAAAASAADVPAASGAAVTAPEQMHDLPEDELVDVVRRLGLVPDEALADPELLGLVLPPLRADFALSETYRLPDGRAGRLPVPVTACGATDDDLLTTEDLAAWAETTSEAFSTRIFEGDHFYTVPHLQEVATLVVEAVEEDLRRRPPSVVEGPVVDYPRDATLHELFRAQAARTPDEVALVDGESSWTFAQLDASSDLLARQLQAKGVVVDAFTGIHLPTSADLVLVYLAALKAGGAYQPVDPSLPPALLADVLHATSPAAIVTSPVGAGDLPAEWHERGAVIVLDEAWEARAEAEGVAVLDDPSSGRELPGPESLAYCVTSSGTTGEPKVIICPHRGAVNSYTWRFRHLPYGEDEREACNVFFVWEVLRPMLQGRPAHVIPDEVIFDPPRLVDQLSRERITRVLFTPSLLDQVLATPGLDLAAALPELRIVYLNGEVVPTALVQRFRRALPHVRLVNDYSISETHDVCTTDLTDLDPAIAPRYAPVGVPMDNVRFCVLDAEQRPVPQGLEGEIYVGGDSLARGYLGRPDLTAERFVPDPLRDDGSLLFRTGDAGRIRDDGGLEIHGRLAFMVKLRGYSVVPAAVESVLRGHDDVAAAAITTLDDEETGSPEHLVAYVVPSSGHVLTDAAAYEDLVRRLREHLKARVAHYAVPSFLVLLDALPLAGTGKLNRRALPDPRSRRRASGATAGQVAGSGAAAATGGGVEVEARAGAIGAEGAGAVRRAVVDVLAEVLGVPDVGLDDNFFDLGGHSLAAAQVCARLRSDHGLEVSVVDVFEHPTARLLATSLGDVGDSPWEAEATGSTQAAEATTRGPGGPIAVVGMACRFPGAPDVDTFWDNLTGGVRAIRELTTEELLESGVPADLLADPSYRRVGALVEGAGDFEPGFWGVSRKEALLMDPQQRLFLECCWQALEHAGQAPRSDGERTGVFGGVFLPTYLLHHLRGGGLLDPRDPMEAHLTEIGNDKDYVTTRVSHLLDLGGPSVAVQTSCSTSLVAVAEACAALQAGRCDTALAGASSLTFPQGGYVYAEGHVSSEDGHCRPFDAHASGTILGDGVGVVVLKRLADAEAAGDPILAVVTGHATNNDGALKAGYSAPSVQGQARVVAAAQDMAGVDADTITYVECHGTGTLVGDPIEVRGLTQVFRRHTDRTGYCAIGSVKGGIGHSNIAAGMAGFIKTVLALRHGVIPPVVDHETPNPALELETSPFYVATELQEWERPSEAPRRAGVSCFGIGGTNAHLVLEEYDPALPGDDDVDGAGRGRAAAGGAGVSNGRDDADGAASSDVPTAGPQLVALSARTPASVQGAALALADALDRDGDLAAADVAWTLATGRERFAHRAAVSGASVADLVSALRGLRAPSEATVVVDPDETPEVVFAFPGQGSQYPGMGRGLEAEVPAFRAAYDECAAILAEDHDLDLRAVALDAEDGPDAPPAPATHLQPALFALEYALARTLLAWGIRPTALVGHSLGEYVAATIAGVLDLRDALALVQTRAAAMEAAGEGAMLAVKGEEARVAPFVADESTVEVAVVNSPRDVVVSGEPEAVARVAARLEEAGIATQRVRTTRAFHSPMMEAAAAAVAERAASVRLHPPRIPLVSNLTGTWLTDEQALDPGYWGRHLRGQVRFADDIATLLQRSPVAVLEVGPGRTVSGVVTAMAADHAASSGTTPPAAVQLGRHPMQTTLGDAQVLLDGIGRLWATGVEPDWAAMVTSQAGRAPRRISLPGYVFDRQRIMPEPADGGLGAVSAAASTADVRLPEQEWTWLPSWRRTLAPQPAASGPRRDRHAPGPDPDSGHAAHRWLLLAGDPESSPRAEALAAAVAEGLRENGELVVATRGSGDGSLASDADAVTVSADADSLTRLLTTLTEQGRAPERIVSLWPASTDVEDPGLPEGFRDAAHLATALTRVGGTEPVHVWTVTERAVQVDDEDVDPLRATVLGPALVVAQENPHVTSRVLDVDPARLADPRAAAVTILGECLPATPDDASIVAWRGRRRWVPTYEPAAVPTAPSRLRADGVYLVTGGLGRIGRVLTDHLRGLGARVVVTTRGEVPEDVADGVTVLRCDPAREGDLGDAFAETLSRHGRLDGVFHAAGLADLTYLGDLDDDLLRAELAPKVLGLQRLDAAVAGLAAQGRAPEFVVLFSSIAGTLGGLAMAAYMAANRCLDTFAQADPRRHGVDWVCIAFDDWDFEYGKEQTAAYAATGADRFAMSTQEGLALLDRLVAMPEPTPLLVSTRPLEPRLERWVRQSVEADEAGTGEGVGAGAGAGESGGSGDDTITRLLAIYEQVLGVSGIGPDDDFFALGGDSLLAAQTLARLRTGLGITGGVQLQDVFTHPTPARLAAHLDGLGDGGDPDETPDPVDAELPATEEAALADA